MGACVEKITHDSVECQSTSKSLQVFYDDAEDKFTGLCFPCHAKGLPSYVFDPYKGEKPPPPTIKTKEEIFEEIQEVRALGVPTFDHRGIRKEYFRKSGVRLAYSEYDGVSPSTFNFPYSLNGELRGFKCIRIDKKVMWSIGETKGCDLFNWEVAKKKKSRRLYITEGEWDCPSLEQMMDDFSGEKYKGTYAITSLPHGAGSAVTTLGRMRREIENLFDEVVLVFDDDKAGNHAVKEVQKLMPNILTMHYPTSSVDANEALQRGEGETFARFAQWKSAKPLIEGVVHVSTVLARSLEPPQMGLSYPWDGFTERTYGQRFGEATAWGAGVGVGKTLLAHEIAAHNIIQHKEKVFLVLLEEDNRDTLLNVSGKIDSIPYHKPEIATDHWERYCDTASSLDTNLLLWDSDGGRGYRFDIDEILQAIRYNTLENGVKFHVIDNMTRLVDHLSTTEANEFINKYSSEIESLTAELNIHIDVYSHLNPPKGKGEVDHEMGGEVRSSQFTGSRGIMRCFPILGGFERNKHADGDLKDNSYISLIKNRKYGGEGKVKTQYQEKTGRLIEYSWDGDSLQGE